MWLVSRSQGAWLCICSINTKSKMTSVTLKIGQCHPKSIGFLIFLETIIRWNMNTIAQKMWPVSRSQGVWWCICSTDTKSKMAVVTLKIDQCHPKSIDFFFSLGTIIRYNMNTTAQELWLVSRSQGVYWSICIINTTFKMTSVTLKIGQGHSKSIGFLFS